MLILLTFKLHHSRFMVWSIFLSN